MYDLIVIGGGPAGAAAAIGAARSGARVLLLERGRFPRHKVCGEFVSAESLDLLHSLLDSHGRSLLRNAQRISRARLFLDGRAIETVVDPAAASIARFDLDAALWDAAQRAGVEARQQTAVQKLIPSTPFVAETSAGDFEATAVVNASGRWSNLTTALHSNGAAGEKWLGVKAHFAEADPEPSVDLYFFEGGYCGVQPVVAEGSREDGRVNACAMVRANVASTLPEVFACHSALRKRSRSWRQVSESVTTSPLIFREPQPEEWGMLNVGDAAGFVDPFVGDGISLALRSGTLAAESLAPFFKGQRSLAGSARAYSELYSQRLLPVFRTSSKLRRLLVLPKALRAPLLFVLQNSPSVAQYVVSKTR